MKSHVLLLGFLVTLVGILSHGNVDAAGLLSSSAQTQGCQCSLTMSCSCCQSVSVDLLNQNSTVCLTLGIGLTSGTINLGATMDGNSVAAFAISTTKPPTYCIPVISMVSVDMCIKVNIKVAGVAVKACPTFYTNYATNQVVSYDFPCIQVGMDGVSLI
ncbi:uncharacterized protein LOC117142857 [Drosophila mauritiana]|uniref:Uncharacterized protein LOC117142857 n=1 Tax=Drosophila mauritiana TaxID=7226 RepID=A0A6P8K2G9_DROMA|nr:uncharacterized protein LOC117142857 [Drosophila mauritiana]